MAKHAFSPMSRRGLLQFGIVAAALTVAGCGGDSETSTKVDTPPTEGGARAQLNKMKEKGEEVLAKKKKK